MTDHAFWRGRRVFVTGHTGFKGAWLGLWLRSLGAIVTGYALRPATTPALFDLARVGDDISDIDGDVRDADHLRAALLEARPEVVMHLAAQALVLPGYTDPVGTYATNVMGTAHLLDAVRTCPGVRAVVVVTSDKCYDNREWLWGYREDEPMGGRDPYSSSKGCAELVTAAFRASFFPPDRHAEHGVAVATARAGNVFGGGDWAPDRLVPDIVRAIERGVPVHVRHPEAVRPWQHVLEPLAGYLRLAQRLVEAPDTAGGAWNFGPHDADARPVRELVEALTAKWGDGARWHADPTARPHEAHHLRLDSSKARTLLGWRPALDLPAALDWTAAWYRECSRGADAKALTLAQIDRHRNLSGA